MLWLLDYWGTSTSLLHRWDWIGRIIVSYILSHCLLPRMSWHTMFDFFCNLFLNFLVPSSMIVKIHVMQLPYENILTFYKYLINKCFQMKFFSHIALINRKWNIPHGLNRSVKIIFNTTFNRSLACQRSQWNNTHLCTSGKKCSYQLKQIHYLFIWRCSNYLQ